MRLNAACILTLLNWHLKKDVFALFDKFDYPNNALAACALLRMLLRLI